MVVNASNVYLLINTENKIIEVNLETNILKDVVKNLKDPSNLNVIHNDECVMFGVSCYGTHSANMYNENWDLLFTFGSSGYEDGQLKYPWGMAYTSEGILVSDYENQRISQFSFEGTNFKI